MRTIKCGVIGVGYLGRFHAQKYQILPNATLVAVADIDPKVCEQISKELAVPAYLDYEKLYHQVEAVSIAATTNQHYEIARHCIAQGIHVLIEKPITETSEQADELIRIAKKHNVKLQVGHLERFNEAILSLGPELHTPLFIESQRLAPFNPRGTDVNVVLDLMIHDIDLIQSIVKSPVVQIEAQGAPVLTKSIDIANARLRFENHCIANVTASRISYKTERKTRIFQPDSYISIDYHNKECAVFKKGLNEMFPGIPEVVRRQSTFAKADALLSQIKAFLHCIEENTVPLVTGEDGRDALATAQKISSLIETHLVLQHSRFSLTATPAAKPREVEVCEKV